MAYFAGTSGRVKAIKVVADLTVDTVTYSGTTAAIASITKWTCNDGSGELPEALTLESGANAEGILYPDLLRGGTGKATFEVEGLFNSSPLTNTTFGNGCFAVCDFQFKKNVAFGYTGVEGRFSNLRIMGSDVRSGNTTFTATFTVDGVLASPS